ncbi:nuclear envelope integral membrane protein 1a-like isoform X2 [Lineus longissimus]|uniref:nuclear envelope integral membrane protein 1a-like isoform X2 n=1 Tax=Lineus longissimus TaxID=88925 RepID=UPI00315D766C
MAAPIKLKKFLLSFSCIFVVLLPADVETATPQYEKLSKKQVFKKDKKTVMKLDLYCFEGEKPFYAKLWMQPLVVLKGGEDVTMYEGVNNTDVEEKYHKAQKSWMSLLVPIIPWKQESIYFNPFQSSCIGIVTKEQYTLSFETKFFDYRLVLMTAIGIFLFIFADSLSGNILFYYSTGISVGVLASFLIVLFIISRFIPKRTGAIAVFTAGSSISLYFLQYLYRNISDVLQEYNRYVIGYFVITGVLSWTFCYWRGPVTNVRTLNLIKWSIQLLSLILIYNSIQIPMMSIVIIVAMVIIHNFPYFAVDFISRRFKRTWHKRFPPKKKRLTQEQSCPLHF